MLSALRFRSLAGDIVWDKALANLPANLLLGLTIWLVCRLHLNYRVNS